MFFHDKLYGVILKWAHCYAHVPVHPRRLCMSYNRMNAVIMYMSYNNLHLYFQKILRQNHLTSRTSLFRMEVFVSAVYLVFFFFLETQNNNYIADLIVWFFSTWWVWGILWILWKNIRELWYASFIVGISPTIMWHRISKKTRIYRVFVTIVLHSFY